MNSNFRAEYASDCLKGCYLPQNGIGTQRQLVRELIHSPETVTRTSYLLEALLSGAASNALVPYDFNDIFSEQKNRELRSMLRQLQDAAVNVQHRTLRALAYDTPYDATNQSTLELAEVAPLFERLIKKGYFPHAPDEKLARMLISSGLGITWLSDYSATGYRMNTKAFREKEIGIIMRDGKDAYTGFHADKLEVMAEIGEAALGVWRAETGNQDYVHPDASLEENWRRLFSEQLPPASVLIASARETAMDARQKLVNSATGK